VGDDNVLQFPDSGDDLGSFGGSPFGVTAFGVDRPAPVLLKMRRKPATYTLRLDLYGAKPPVWRRLALTSDLTLDRVHQVIQLSMGWFDCHLHHFKMGPGAKDYFVHPFLTDYDLSEGEDEGTPESQVRLDQVLGKVGDRLFYEYDFGDGWAHTLKLEKVEDYNDGAIARCLAGRRACPPEDIGGVHTFNDVVAWLAAPDSDPADEDFSHFAEWLPEGYDPAQFDHAEADHALTEGFDAGPLRP